MMFVGKGKEGMGNTTVRALKRIMELFKNYALIPKWVGNPYRICSRRVFMLFS